MKNFEMLFNSFEPAPIINAIDYNKYAKINLSVSNTELTENKLEAAEEFEAYVEDFLESNNAKVAYGGYLEERKLYKRSSIFNDSNSSERNMHIGLDLWIKAGSVINAPIEGTVHSFKNNIGLGDYGPTIILEHQIENLQFYTLYGHLSLESIADLKVGKLFKKGEPLATLGNKDVNGNYAPHLHFQIINTIENYWGDYPGVCSKQDLDFYMENCPNPNLILNI
ncbi:peptidoglycan DD-metalloendopeptidase family protein [Flavobacterium sp. TMP13]|uniref:peptidoglycan DD-metalloendopeptidase family protein n=1 Tax=unclassified Flavobacterium TaxID=196869 RepID=UPI00076D00B9|nr:peptidoglycan DD-metalloendopeptidase family protein [Flavobacterium sp. TAB 87]KVV14713.1 Peptidase family M23 [Flavobacterium sp. TAB 87]